MQAEVWRASRAEEGGGGGKGGGGVFHRCGSGVAVVLSRAQQNDSTYYSAERPFFLSLIFLSRKTN